MLEIEKKFLLPPCKAKLYLKALGKKYKKEHIIQYYAKNMRFRKIGNRYWRTIKSGSGMVREEFEEPISKSEFYALWDQKDGESIQKYRYAFRYKKHRYEMDEFKGHLKGLLYLEIEFDSLKAAQAFTPPKKIQKFILDEVTDNPAFTNRSLAIFGMPTISHPLSQLISQNEPENYLSASLKLSFHPFENVHTVLRVWIALLAKVIEMNQKAILAKEEDTERLHQLRVALRKIRSLLALLAKMIELPEAKELEKLAKAIMKQTNKARDLDVYLDWLTEYEQMLPTKLASNLQALKERLQKDRNAAYDTLLHMLQSPEFSLLLSKLHAFASSEPIQKVSSIILGKRMLMGQLHGVWEKASRLTPKSKPHKYHLARIEIKKLRYMIEFFSFIFEQERYQYILANIKKLQNILGEHQDTTVQMEYIKTMLQKDLLEPQKEGLLFIFSKLEQRADKLRKKFRKRSKLLQELHHELKKAMCRR